jgi:hypothetical protein
VSSEHEDEQSAARLFPAQTRALAAYLCIKMLHIMKIKGCCLCAAAIGITLFLLHAYTTFEYSKQVFRSHADVP